MKQIHFITGVPRSGSTLLCNVLNQNPEFYAGSTSPLPALVNTLVNCLSNSHEVQAALINDEENTNIKLDLMVSQVIENWYYDRSGIIFDKSRGWSFNGLLIAKLFPDAKIITCVRDLRGVFGSVEKQHAKNPTIDLAATPNDKTIIARADKMLAPDGLIGQCVMGTNDLIARMPKRTFIFHYESFTRDPINKMHEFYEFMEMEHYTHDFENIENVSEDVDALYHNKFPHVGAGKIKPTDLKEWQEYLPSELSNRIFNAYPDYNKNCGYQ